MTEEQALYAAILAAPYDNTPRLVYADCLDELASSLPTPIARAEQARAEFIRVQCTIAGAEPAGWRRETAARETAQTNRVKRLHFRCGRKWRRAFPASLASHPFDRGFLRPYLSMRPHEFIHEPVAAPLDSHGRLQSYRSISPLPPDSPARRYIPNDGDCLSACPLWDIHLYGSDYPWDSAADRGQYGPAMSRVADSPMIERVGLLQVSFFMTPMVEFLRTGRFMNVETLLVNCVPFPDVLAAVAENESFRSLRYVWFGPDRWAWATTSTAMTRYVQIVPRLDEANARNLPYGEMRSVLREILRNVAGTPLSTLQLATSKSPPPTPPTGRTTGGSELTFRESVVSLITLLGMILLAVSALCAVVAVFREPRQPPAETPIPRLELLPKVKAQEEWERLTPEEFEVVAPWLRFHKVLPPRDSLQRTDSGRIPMAPPPRPKE